MDRWSVWVSIFAPIALIVAVLSGSVMLAMMFNPIVGLIAFLFGGLAAGVTAFVVGSDKLRIADAVALNCPNCQTSVTHWNGAILAIDYLCRKCGRPHARLAE